MILQYHIISHLKYHIIKHNTLYHFTICYHITSYDILSFGKYSLRLRATLIKMAPLGQTFWYCYILLQFFSAMQVNFTLSPFLKNHIKRSLVIFPSLRNYATYVLLVFTPQYIPKSITGSVNQE